MGVTQALGISNEFLGFPFTDGDAFDLLMPFGTGGLEQGIFPEGVVDEASIVGIERFGFDRAAMIADSLGKLVNAVQEGIVPNRAVMFDIDDDPGSIPVLRKEDAVYEKLKTLKGFVATTDQVTGIIGADLEDRVAVP